MTNLILNIYSTLVEIFLWLIVIGFTIGGAIAGFPLLGPVGVVLGGIFGFLAGIIFCLIFISPMMLLMNIRDHLKSVQPVNISDHLKLVQNDTYLILRQATAINENLKGYVDSTRRPEVTGDEPYRTTVQAGTENEDTHRRPSGSGRVRATAHRASVFPKLNSLRHK
jgi:hypothetical protein